jgi:hypothetical protein
MRLIGAEARNRFLRTPAGRAAARISRRRILHCLGDSHARVFLDVRRRLRRTWLDVRAVAGTMAIGLSNPNSRSGALTAFRQIMSGLPRDEHLLFMLGAGDCTYLLWHQQEKLGRPLEKQLATSFATYTGFLDGLLDEGRGNLVVAAVPLPAVFDDDETVEDLPEYRRVSASLADRTELTRRYNRMLRRWTADRGVGFLDFERDLLDPERGVIRDEFRRRHRQELHLRWDLFSPILARRLAEIGYP